MQTNVRLKIYLESLGNRLPDDWKHHQNRTDVPRCIFCGDKYPTEPVYIYQPVPFADSPTRIDCENLSCCNQCNDHIEHMLDTEYPGIEWLTKSEPYVKSADPVNMGEDASNRLKAYLSRKEFSVDIHKYYRHLNSDVDLYVGDLPKSCYFCGEYCDNTKVHTIEVPVEPSIEVTGGAITVCPVHWHKIISTVPDPKRWEIDRCTRCGKQYSITKDELVNRENAKSKGRHYCPSCLYQQIDDYIRKDSYLYLEKNNRPRTAPMTRYKEIRCYLCESDVGVDISLSESYLFKYHLVTESPEKAKPICGAHACILVKHLEYSKVKQIGENRFLEVVKTDSGDGWYCNLHTLDLKSLTPKKLLNTKSHETIAEALFQGKELFDKNFPERGKQTSMW